jgi:hypothetical protein
MKEQLNDFGFSVMTEEELKQYEKFLEEQIEQYKYTHKQKLQELYNLFLPLLNNLKKDPDKEYIYWPNRADKINEFVRKIEAFIEEN